MRRRILASLALCCLACPAVEGAPIATTPEPPQMVLDGSAPAPEKQASVPTPVAGRAHTIEASDGHPLAVWEKTPARPRDAIVLIHGRTWSGRPDFDLQVHGEQRSLMDALVRKGFATYAVDMRGYGATPRDKTGWITPDRAVKDLATVLDWVGQRAPRKPPALLGWSLGSLVAQLAVQKHPDKVAAVILYGYPRRPGHRASAGPAAGSKPPAHKTTAKAAAEDFIIPGSISEAAKQAFVDAALAADPVRADWRSSDQFNVLEPGKVRVPTLLIHGERDPYAPVSTQARLFEQLGHPDRAWVIVAGGDHAAHLEDAGPRFVNAVVSFVRR